MPRTAARAYFTTRVEPEGVDHDVLVALEDESGQLVMRASDGREISLPDELARLVQASARTLARGDVLLAVPLETHLTPNEAAELLGLSRPFLLKLIDDGRLPAENLPGSRHRQLRLADVLEFQTSRDRRREATQRIREVAEEYDLPY